MKINKYKKLANGKYKVTLDQMDLVLYEEVILKYNLLITKKIDSSMLEEINNDNMFYEVYYCGLNSIKSRPRSVEDVKELLLNKNLPREMVDKAIDKLVLQGYLNDLFFIKAFINNQLSTTNNGPYKIKSLLSEHRVDLTNVDKELEVFTYDLQLEKINKLAARFYKSNNNKGGYVLKKKISNDLLNYGYDINLIEKVLGEFSFDNNEEIAKKEYDKLYKKLSRKYTGSELEKKIKEKLYLKGLKVEKK